MKKNLQNKKILFFKILGIVFLSLIEILCYALL